MCGSGSTAERNPCSALSDYPVFLAGAGEARSHPAMLAAKLFGKCDVIM